MRYFTMAWWQGVQEGLTEHPHDDYFASYTRVVWLAQEPDHELRGLAQAAADRIGLPLTVVDTGNSGLEAALANLVGPKNHRASG